VSATTAVAPPPAQQQRGPLAIPVPAGEIFTVATEYVEAGRLDAAERMLGHILNVAPKQADAVHLKGLIAFRRGKIAEAGELMERSIAEGGGQKAAHFRNLSEVYRLQAKLDEALAAARRSIALDPADPLGPFNLAMVHYDRLETDACIAAAKHSLDLRPNLPQSHMKLAQVRLLRGEMEEGWDEYEWRYQIPGAQPLMPKTEKPQWDGGNLGEGRLLLVADQGFGDVVMFMRYIPWVQSVVKNVVVACSAEMLPTIARHFPTLQLFNRWDQCPDYVAYCPFSGLPRLKKTRIDSIPGETPYMHPDPEKMRVWEERLKTLTPGGLKRIGIAWAGRPTHNNNINRSIQFPMLAPICDLEGIALLSLQKGKPVEEIAGYQGRAPLVDLDKQLETFEDTMAVISQLDLLVTVDTAIGHFAGAMNRPAWIMVPHAPDWRWLLTRSDTPWYPSLRLFRHPAPRRWDLVIPAVAAELRRHVATLG
jgi:hypothetical protein